jgi:hypothetical protein
MRGTRSDGDIRQDLQPSESFEGETDQNGQKESRKVML